MSEPKKLLVNAFYRMLPQYLIYKHRTKCSVKYVNVATYSWKWHHNYFVRSIYTTLKDRFEATLGNVLFSLAVPLVEKWMEAWERQVNVSRELFYLRRSSSGVPGCSSFLRGRIMTVANCNPRKVITWHFWGWPGSRPPPTAFYPPLLTQLRQ